jgi:LysR family transcriptional regulator, mexEF-oprN operon transcriptional activator
MVLMMTIDHAYIARVDLNLLVAFDALMTEGNVGRAGERVGMTQSAMSHNLSRLRRVFNDELFFRGPGGVRPTPRARELGVPVSAILTAVQSELMENKSFDAASANRRFSVGISGYLAPLVIPLLVERVMRAAPNVSLDVSVLEGEVTTELLDDHAIDVAIGKVGTLGVLHRSSLLWDERYVALSRPEALDADGRLNLAAYKAAPHVVVTGSEGSCTFVNEALARAGVARRAVVRTDHIGTVPDLVRDAHLMATIPASFGAHLLGREGLAVSAVPVHVDAFPIHVSWHASFTNDAAQRWLRDRIQEAVAPLSSAAHELAAIEFQEQTA